MLKRIIHMVLAAHDWQDGQDPSRARGAGLAGRAAPIPSVGSEKPPSNLPRGQSRWLQVQVSKASKVRPSVISDQRPATSNRDDCGGGASCSCEGTASSAGEEKGCHCLFGNYEKPLRTRKSGQFFHYEQVEVPGMRPQRDLYFLNELQSQKSAQEVTVYVSKDYPTPLGEKLRKAFNGFERVKVTDVEPSSTDKDTVTVLCLCENFASHNGLLALAKKTLGLLKPPASLEHTASKSRLISRPNRAASNHATTGAAAATAPGVAPRGAAAAIADVRIREMVARKNRGEACEDKTGAPNAVLLYDDSLDFSKYTADLESPLRTQEFEDFFKPMWSLWPSTDMLQKATADSEVRKIRKRSAETVSKRAARRRSVIARAFATGGSRRADVEAP